MNAKEAFRLADSILRYERADKYGDYAPAKFDDKRNIITEMRTISNEIMGAAYKAHTIDWNSSRFCPSGRIMKMYKKKHKPRWKLVLMEDIKRYPGPRNWMDIVGMMDDDNS